jgi:hypothetical protein
MKRADCEPGGIAYQRPCPHTQCRYHLAAPPDGKTRGRQPTGQRDESQSCALDVAADGMHGLVDIGRLLGVSRERVRQLETSGLKKAKRAARKLDLDLGDIVPHREHALATIGEGNEYDSRGRNRERLREANERWRAKRQQGGAK